MKWVPINWEFVSLYNLTVIVLMITLAGVSLAYIFPQAAMEQ